MLVHVDRGDLGKPTPCGSWDVRTLVNHMVSAPRVAAARVSGLSGTPPDELARDFAAGDMVDAYDESARVAMVAFSAPGALEKPVELPVGTMPAALLMFFAASDQVTHAWDLARAIGASTDLAPGLAAALLDEATETVTLAMRGEEGEAPFGLPQTAPPGASNADRLAAFLGRRV